MGIDNIYEGLPDFLRKVSMGSPFPQSKMATSVSWTHTMLLHWGPAMVAVSKVKSDADDFMVDAVTFVLPIYWRVIVLTGLLIWQTPTNRIGY